MAEIRKADPSARRQALLFVLSAGFAGGLLIVAYAYYREPFYAWLWSGSNDLNQRLAIILSTVAAGLTLPLGCFALHLERLSRQVRAAGEYPPPGHRVLRDMPIKSGRAARAQARLLRCVALILATVIVLLAVLCWRFAEVFGGGDVLPGWML